MKRAAAVGVRKPIAETAAGLHPNCFHRSKNPFSPVEELLA